MVNLPILYGNAFLWCKNPSRWLPWETGIHGAVPYACEGPAAIHIFVYPHCLSFQVAIWTSLVCYPHPVLSTSLLFATGLCERASDAWFVVPFHHSVTPLSSAINNRLYGTKYKEVSHTHTLIVGWSVTTVKVKVKGQGCRFVLNQWSRSLFLTLSGQWHIILPQLILKSN